MPKRLLAMLLVLVFAFSLCGCDILPSGDAAEGDDVAAETATGGTDASLDEGSDLEADADADVDSDADASASFTDDEGKPAINVASIIVGGPWYGVVDLVDSEDLGGTAQGTQGTGASQEGQPGASDAPDTPGATDAPGSSDSPDAPASPDAGGGSGGSGASDSPDSPSQGGDAGSGDSLLGLPVDDLPEGANIVYESLGQRKPSMTQVDNPSPAASPNPLDDGAQPIDAAPADGAAQGTDADVAADADADAGADTPSQGVPDSVRDLAGQAGSGPSGPSGSSSSPSSVFPANGVDLEDFEDVYKISFNLKIEGWVDETAQGVFSVVRGTDAPVSYVVDITLDTETMTASMTCDSEAALTSEIWVQGDTQAMLTIPTDFVFGDLALQDALTLPDAETMDVLISDSLVEAESDAIVCDILTGETTTIAKSVAETAASSRPTMTASADSVDGFVLVYDANESKWSWKHTEDVAASSLEDSDDSTSTSDSEG